MFLTFKVTDIALRELCSAGFRLIVEYFAEVTERDPALVQFIYQGQSVSVLLQTYSTSASLLIHSVPFF